MAKGMSPLRLFMRNGPRRTGSDGAEGNSSASDSSLSSLGSGALSRQPLGPITETARNPLTPAVEQQAIGETTALPRGKSEHPTPRASRGKHAGQEKFPHLENSEGILNLHNVGPDPNASASAAAPPPLGSKRKYTWQQHRQGSIAQSDQKDGTAAELSTPTRPFKQQSASSDVLAQPVALGGNILGTQQIVSGNLRGGGGGGSVPSTPKSVRVATGNNSSSNESENGGGSRSQNGTPSKTVSRSLKYGQQTSSNNSQTALGQVTNVRSTGSQHAITRAAGYLQPIKGVAPQQLMYQNFVEQHFELEEDSKFWRDHNVQVLIRTRPISKTELASQGISRCLKQESPHTLSWLGQPESRFTFDHVAGETVTQAKLFDVAGLPMVENCMSGYNSCMFAYGQTGSGKTHTMLGDIEALDRKPSENRGMTPRVFEYLFGRIRMEEECRRQEYLKFSCKCSFLEIYNEQITDLLEPSSTNLQMREDAKKGVYVENLSEVEVQGVNDVIQLLLQGAANRKVAATNMNRESSRSHSVFTCVVESKWESNSMTNCRYGRLHLVDLAGSERQKSSGAEGGRLKEAANINKSLSTLGLVIMILVDVANGKQRHVPYRDSKLTFLLQDSLGGNSKTIMIANVSPSSCCAMETLSTLKFAQRAKFIRNNAVINEDAAGDVFALRQQIEELKVEVDRLRRESISRTPSLRFLALQSGSIAREESADQMDISTADCGGAGSLSPDSVNTACKPKLKSATNHDKKLRALESVLEGALRREQTTEDVARKQAAEIEQLNRLVRQREEDSQCSKMILRFREEKIRRLEAITDNVLGADLFNEDEKKNLEDELQLLRGRLDRNPELTRFAMENINLSNQIRSYQSFYDCGEKDLLLEEISGLRSQLLEALETKLGELAGEELLAKLSTPQKRALAPEFATLSRENELLRIEADSYEKELKECRGNLNSCLEANADLSRQVDDLQATLNQLKAERAQKQQTQDEQSTSNAAARAELQEQLKNALEELENLQQKIQASETPKERLITTAEVASRLHETEAGLEASLAAAQETASSATSALKQMRVETEELASQRKQSLTDLEAAALIWRKQEAELRQQLKDAEDLIEKLSADVAATKSASRDEVESDGGRDGALKRLASLQEVEMRHSEEVAQLQLELETLEEALKDEEKQRQAAEERSEDLKNQLNLALSKVEEGQTLVEALEGQQLFSLNELENLEAEHAKLLESVKQQEDEKRRHQEQLYNRNVEDDSAVLILEQKLENARRGKEEARKINRKFQDEKASQLALEKEREVIMSEVETQAALAITTLQSEILDLKEEVSAAAEVEADSKLQILRLRKDVEALEHTVGRLKDQNQHLSEEYEKYQKLVNDKDVQLRVLEGEWKIAAAKLMDQLADGDQALTEAAKEMDVIIDEEEDASDTEHAIASEKRKAVEAVYRRLQDVQLLAREAEGNVRALKDVTVQLGDEGGRTDAGMRDRGCQQGEATIRESEKKSMGAFLIVGQLVEKVKDLKAAEVRLGEELHDAHVALAGRDRALADLEKDVEHNVSAHTELSAQHQMLLESYKNLQEEYVRSLGDNDRRAENAERMVQISEKKAMAALVLLEHLSNAKKEAVETKVMLEKAQTADAQKDTVLAALKEQLMEGDHQYTEIAEQHGLLIDAHERLKAEHEDSQAEHERLLKEQGSTVEEKGHMIRMAERKASAAFVMVEQLAGKRMQLETEIVRLQTIIQSAHKALEQNEQSVVVLQQQLKQESNHAAENKQQHEVLKDVHQGLQQEHARVLEEHSSAVETAEQKQQSLVALQQRLDEKCDDAVEVYKRHELLKDVHQRLQQEHDKLLEGNELAAKKTEDSVRLSESKALAAFVIVQNLAEKGKGSEAENARLTQEVEEVHKKDVQKDARLYAVQQELQQGDAKYSEIVGRFDLVLTELESLRAEHGESKAKYEEVLGKNELLAEDCDRKIKLSEKKATAAFVMLEQFTSKKSALEATNASLERDIHEAHSVQQQKDAHISALLQQIDQDSHELMQIADRQRQLVDERDRLQEEHERSQAEFGKLLVESASMVDDRERTIGLSERRALIACVMLKHLTDTKEVLAAANGRLEKEKHLARAASEEKDIVLATLQAHLEEERYKCLSNADERELLMGTHQKLKSEVERLRGEIALIAEEKEKMITLSERKASAAFVMMKKLMDLKQGLTDSNDRLQKQINEAHEAAAQKDITLNALEQQLEGKELVHMELADENQRLLEAHQKLTVQHEKALVDNASIVNYGERMIKASEKKAMVAVLMIEHLTDTVNKLELIKGSLREEAEKSYLALSRKDAELMAQTREVEDTSCQLDELCGDHRLLVEKFENLKENYETCATTNGYLQRQIEALGSNITQNDSRVNILREALLSAEQDVATVEEKVLDVAMKALSLHDAASARAEQFIASLQNMDVLAREMMEVEGTLNHFGSVENELNDGLSKVLQLEKETAEERRLVESLQAEVSSLVVSIDVRERELENAREERDDCIVALGKEIASAKTWAQERDLLAFEKEQSRSESFDKEKEVQGLHLEVQTLEANLRDAELRVAEMLTAVQALTVAKVELELERDRLASSAYQAEMDCSLKENALTAMQNDFADSQARLIDAEQRAQTMCGQLDELTNATMQLDVEKAAVEREIQAMRDEKAHVVCNVTWLNSELVRRESALFEIFVRSQHALDEINSRMTAMGLQLADLEALEGQLLDQDLEMLESAASGQIVAAENRNDEYLQLMKRVESAEVRIAEMLRTADSAAAHASVEKDNWEAEKRNVEEENETREVGLRAELEVLKTTKMNLGREMSSLQLAASSHMTALEEKEHELHGLQRKLEHAESYTSEMQTAIDSASDQFLLEKNAWEAEKMKLEEESNAQDNQLRNEIARAELRLSATEQSLKTASDNIEALSLKKSQLDKEMLRLNEDAEVSLAKVREQEVEINSLKEESQALRLECAEAANTVSALNELRDQYSLSEMRWRSEQESLTRKLEGLEALSRARDVAAVHEREQGDDSGAGTSTSRCLPSAEQASGGEMYVKEVEKQLQKERLDNDSLRRKIGEKDTTILSARKEMEVAIANLKEAESEMDKVHREKERLSKSHLEKCNLIGSISFKLKAAEDELWKRENRIEGCEAELRKVAVILSDWDVKMHVVEEEWRKEKEALARELTEAKLDASEKRSEAAALHQKFQDGQATLKEAEGLVDALVRANENAKYHALDWKSEKESLGIVQGWWMPERDRLVSVIANLETDMHTQRQDLWMVCKETLLGMVEAMEVVALASQEVSFLKNDQKHEMDLLLREMDLVKSDLVSSLKFPVDVGPELEAFVSHRSQAVQLAKGAEIPDNLRELHAELENCKTTIVTLENELREKISKIHDLEQNFSDMERANADNEKTMTGMIMQFTSERDSVLKENVGLKAEITNLEAQICNFESKVGETTTRGIDSRSEGTSAGEDKSLQELESQLAEAQAAVQLVELELEDKKVIINNLSDKLKSAFDENALLEEKHDHQIRQWEEERGHAENQLMEQLLNQNVLGGRLEHTRVEKDAVLLEKDKLLGRVKNVEQSYAVCVSDLLASNNAMSAEVAVLKQLQLEMKGLKEDMDDVKVQTSACMMNEVQASHEGMSSSTRQVAALRSEVRELGELSSAVEVSVARRHNAVRNQLQELMSEQKQMAERARCHLQRLEYDRTSLLSYVEEILKKFESVSFGAASYKQTPEKSLEDQEFAAALEQQLHALDAEIEQVLHEKSAMQSQMQKLRPRLAAAESEVDEYKSQLRVLMEAASQNEQRDQLLQVHQQEFTNTNELLISTLESCATLVSELPDFAAEREELKTLRSVGEVWGKLRDDFEDMKEDVQNFEEVAEGERHIRTQHTSVATKQQSGKLIAHLQDLESRNSALEEELDEKRHALEVLAEEFILEEERLAQSLELITNELQTVEGVRDKFQTEIVVLNEQLEMAQTLADERDLVAAEARQVAELSKSQAEEKEEEARILGRSVEELESTVFALETQLGIVKQEAERQRVAREVLESELASVRDQMGEMQATIDNQEAQTVKGIHDAENSRIDLDRIVIELKNQQVQARESVESLQQECAEKDVQLRSCKAHIAELMLGAEKQASENQQKLKNLESMVEHLKLDDRKANPGGPSAGKGGEKSATTKKGAGSPFKCIGAALSQQRSSEIDEELTSAKKRIKEIEAVAAARQKEIFMLNTKLAEAESMTHDVVRDLLGVKMDIASYASLLNQQQMQRIAERARRRTEEAQEKEEEMDTLRSRLTEFIDERESWLEEINRRQAEAVAARVSAEKLRLRDQTLTEENEKFQAECLTLHKRVTELEDEVKKLSGQQNLQQRIHHHAKIKEENNSFRMQIEDLSAKLRRLEVLFTRVNDELAQYRTANGKSAYLNFDEEANLKKRLQETEENRLHLAQTLSALCSGIMQAAGLQRPSKDIDPPAAFAALQQLQDRLDTVERELSDYQLKARIAGEKRRISDLRERHTPVKNLSTNFLATQQLPSPVSSSR